MLKISDLMALLATFPPEMPVLLANDEGGYSHATGAHVAPVAAVPPEWCDPFAGPLMDAEQARGPVLQLDRLRPDAFFDGLVLD